MRDRLDRDEIERRMVEIQSEDYCWQNMKNNWATLRAKKIVTKEEFFNEITQTCIELIDKRKDTIKQRLGRLTGEDAEESFKILKQGFKYIIFLTISVIFSFRVRES